MTELANQPSSTVAPTSIVPEVLPKAAKQWLGYVSPVVQRFTGAVLDTRSAIESRLGFCPLKIIAKGASEQLDVLAGGLHRIASLLRAAAGVPADTQATASSSPESPRAQA